MMTAITNGLDALRMRYNAHLSALAAAVQAERASGASKLAELESLVSSLKVQVASLQSNVSTAEDALVQERSASVALRQRVTNLNAELDTVKASLKSTTENATAASAQVVVLTKKLSDTSDQVRLGYVHQWLERRFQPAHCWGLQLTKANESLTETTAELQQAKTAAANLERETREKVESLTQRALKAEAQFTEESRQRAELEARLVSTESQVSSIFR
jgi:predicted  nucleic acid-binding Zn-ribbon protein